jgi:hypothetical protein
MGRWTIAAGSTLLAVACFGGSGGDGDGTTGGAPKATTGELPPSTPLSEVTLDDLVAVCRANRTLVEMSFANVEYQCLDEALARASDAEECEQFRSECEMQLASDQGDACAFTDPPDFSGCTGVTLSEMLTCMEDLAAFAKTLDCSLVGSEVEYPASCQDVNRECPGVLD